MPIDYKKYPSNWKEIRKQVLKRANNCCEFCGLPNYAEGYRDKKGNFIHLEQIFDKLNNEGHDYFQHELSHCFNKQGMPTKMIKIILTIAHLDHDAENHSVSIDRLRALCQKCHNKYDMPNRVKNRKSKKKTKQQTIF